MYWLRVPLVLMLRCARKDMMVRAVNLFFSGFLKRQIRFMTSVGLPDIENNRSDDR